MKTKTCLLNHERQMLDYVVGDFLEMKASLGVEESSGLKSYLYSQAIGNSEIISVEGFYLGGHLILLKKINPWYFRHLVTVTPGNGKIQARELPSS